MAEGLKAASLAVSHSHSQFERQATSLPSRAVSCLQLAEKTVREELAKALPDIAKVSIVLGAIEGPLTVKDAKLQHWPEDLEVGLLPSTAHNVLQNPAISFAACNRVLFLQADFPDAMHTLDKFLSEARMHLQKVAGDDTRVITLQLMRFNAVFQSWLTLLGCRMSATSLSMGYLQSLA